MKRKTIQIDLNTHNWLVKFCKKRGYKVGGWAGKILRDAMYLDEYGKKPVRSKKKEIVFDPNEKFSD